MAETTITEQIVREAPDIEAYRLGLIESAKALSDVKRTLPTQQVAALPTDITDAMTAGRAGVGAFQPYITAAGAGLGDAATTAGLGVTQAQAAQTAAAGAPAAIQAGMVAPTQAGLQQFMNPYQQSVIDESLAEINRQGQLQEQQVAAGAVQAGAFGGARHGVQEAELQRGLTERRNQITASLNQQNYQQAMGAFDAQRRREIAGGQALGQLAPTFGALAGQFGQLGQMQAGLGMQQAQLGGAQQQMGTQDVDLLTRMGQLQQQQSQRQLEATRLNELQSISEPYERVGWLSDIYKGIPTTQQSMTRQVAPSVSPLMQAGAVGLAGLTGAAAAQRLGLFGGK